MARRGATHLAVGHPVRVADVGDKEAPVPLEVGVEGERQQPPLRLAAVHAGSEVKPRAERDGRLA